MFDLMPGQAHRVMAPRVVFLLGTRSPEGHVDCMPICYVGMVSGEPEIVSIAVYRDWISCGYLREAEGFTLSVPRESSLADVWKMGGKSSGYIKISKASKEDEFSEVLNSEFSKYGPVLASALAWIECRILRKVDDLGDHMVVYGEITGATARVDSFNDSGNPLGGANTLMQWSGNLFTAPGATSCIPYFEPPAGP
jgi:flavin reductase (DIM6/NTAB) family NADH-FMN oxidoreductase RutF